MRPRAEARFFAGAAARGAPAALEAPRGRTSGALPYSRGSVVSASSGFSALRRRYSSGSTWGESVCVGGDRKGARGPPTDCCSNTPPHTHTLASILSARFAYALYSDVALNESHPNAAPFFSCARDGKKARGWLSLSSVRRARGGGQQAAAVEGRAAGEAAGCCPAPHVLLRLCLRHLGALQHVRLAGVQPQALELLRLRGGQVGGGCRVR